MTFYGVKGARIRVSVWTLDTKAFQWYRPGSSVSEGERASESEREREEARARERDRDIERKTETERDLDPRHRGHSVVLPPVAVE